VNTKKYNTSSNLRVLGSHIGRILGHPQYLGGLEGFKDVVEALEAHPKILKILLGSVRVETFIPRK
jgi:hypothetical protein